MQIDAAINPGNSGGPAFANLARSEVVGVAFSRHKNAEATGYIIPYVVVEHFLESFNRRGLFQGLCCLGVLVNRLENPSLRRYHKVRPPRPPSPLWSAGCRAAPPPPSSPLQSLTTAQAHRLYSVHSSVPRRAVILMHDRLPLQSLPLTAACPSIGVRPCCCGMHTLHGHRCFYGCCAGEQAGRRAARHWRLQRAMRNSPPPFVWQRVQAWRRRLPLSPTDQRRTGSFQVQTP